MADVEEPSASRQYEKDGRTWRIGVQDDVSWIQRGLTRDTPTTAITAAIPPEFEAYATVALCEGELGARTPTDPDAALFNVLQAHTEPQPWWLGYLETGASDVIFPEAPRVRLYWDWGYVMVRAGPEQAASWSRDQMWNWSLPALMFPESRAWLVSLLWDDDWVSVGGSAELITRLEQHPQLAQSTFPCSVSDPEAAPPGLRALI
jgi:hypothetical protein